MNNYLIVCHTLYFSSGSWTWGFFVCILNSLVSWGNHERVLVDSYILDILVPSDLQIGHIILLSIFFWVFKQSIQAVCPQGTISESLKFVTHIGHLDIN